MRRVENAFWGVQGSFRAPDELAVARHLLRHHWEYEDVFWALRVSLYKEVESLTPEELLQAIHDSYYNRHVRAVLYLLPIGQTADCVPAEANDVQSW